MLSNLQFLLRPPPEFADVKTCATIADGWTLARPPSSCYAPVYTSIFSRAALRAAVLRLRALHATRSLSANGEVYTSLSGRSPSSSATAKKIFARALRARQDLKKCHVFIFRQSQQTRFGGPRPPPNKLTVSKLGQRQTASYCA